MRLRLAGALVAAVGGSLLGAAPASAHSPTDFLKVGVGVPSTILLPPMTTLPGRMEVSISSPATFHLTGVSAGPGWQARIAPTAALLDGRTAAGHSLLITVTGTAARPGRLPIDVRLSSPAAPTQTYHWRVTALAGYAQPVSSLSGASRPDAAVATGSTHDSRSWPISVVFAIAALLVLVTGKRTYRRSAAG